MIIYLVGIYCVGKTTIGNMLAERIGFSFFDLDEEVQNYYKKPIERIQDEFLTMNEFREKASIVLDLLLSKNIDSVISGTPAGLKFSYLRVYKKHKVNKELYSIHIKDSFKNVLDRLTFYDKDSNPIIEIFDESQKKRYLKDIKEDYNYFKSSYNRADIMIDIENVRLDDIPDLIIEELRKNKILSAANTQYT